MGKYIYNLRFITKRTDRRPVQDMAWVREELNAFNNSRLNDKNVDVNIQVLIAVIEAMYILVGGKLNPLRFNVIFGAEKKASIRVFSCLVVVQIKKVKRFNGYLLSSVVYANQ